MPLSAMPTDTIIVVSAIVAAFCVFAVALAWGERQTRALPAEKRPSQPTANTQSPADVVKALAHRPNSNDAVAKTGKRTPDKSAA